MTTIDNIMALADEYADEKQISARFSSGGFATTMSAQMEFIKKRAALLTALIELASTATEYQQAADKMAMEHKTARDALRQQLAEAQALIEASRKQDPIYQYQMGDGSWVNQTQASYEYNKRHAPNATVRIVYAAPVVAPDVLKDAEPDKQLCKFYNVHTFPELVEQMERHIRKLQSQLPIRQVFTNQKVREG